MALKKLCRTKYHAQILTLVLILFQFKQLIGEIAYTLDRIEHLMRDRCLIHLKVAIVLLDILVQVLLGDISNCVELAESILKVHLLALDIYDLALLLLANSSMLFNQDLVNTLFRWLVFVLALL